MTKQRKSVPTGSIIGQQIKRANKQRQKLKLERKKMASVRKKLKCR